MKVYLRFYNSTLSALKIKEIACFIACLYSGHDIDESFSIAKTGTDAHNFDRLLAEYQFYSENGRYYEVTDEQYYSENRDICSIIRDGFSKHYPNVDCECHFLEMEEGVTDSVYISVNGVESQGVFEHVSQGMTVYALNEQEYDISDLIEKGRFFPIKVKETGHYYIPEYVLEQYAGSRIEPIWLSEKFQRDAETVFGFSPRYTYEEVKARIDGLNTEDAQSLLTDLLADDYIDDETFEKLFDEL